MMVFGESALLLAIPLIVGLILTVSLSERLEIKDAVAYPFVQYAFFLLLFYLFWAYPNVGLGLIIMIPMIYIVNIAVGYSYFRFVKNKTMRGKILVLLATLLITSLLYAEHYGQNSGTPALFRMLGGDFGYTSWTREYVKVDTLQTTSDGIFEYQLEQIHRSTPLRSNTELRLFVRDLSTGAEYRIRLDDVMDEARLRQPSMTYGQDVFWSTMQPVDRVDKGYLLTTTSAYAPVRRWVFELNMETQTVSLLEQIHVGMLARTEDDKFIANLYMVNFFDNERRSVRLVMVDTTTREIIQIPIEIDVAEIIVQNFDHSWVLISPAVREIDEETGISYVVQPPKRVVEVIPTDVHEIYFVILREGFLVIERNFELDMNTRTMRELY